MEFSIDELETIRSEVKKIETVLKGAVGITNKVVNNYTDSIVTNNSYVNETTLFGNDIVIDSGQSFLEWGEQEYIVSTPPPPFYGDIKKDMGDTADDGISNQEYLTACKEYYEKQT
jgi:hypothetical protein